MSTTLEVLEYHFNCYKELKRISHSLSRLDVNACNYGLTPRQEKRVEKLEKRAEEIAKSIGLKSYHQGDPRGLSLYIIAKDMNNTNYNRGIAIS